MTDKEKKAVVHRWIDAINRGDLNTLYEVVDHNVTDHSGLSAAHGHGCEGHVRVVDNLLKAIPRLNCTIDDMAVQGDKVTVRFRGRGALSEEMKGLLAVRAPDGPQDFTMVSTVRIANGKIVEHWANQGPFGRMAEQPVAHQGPYPPPTSTTPPPSVSTSPAHSREEENKLFLQNYVHYVIDGQNPALGDRYFASNFFNHDPAPGEEPGLEGVKKFISSIFAAFSGFHTTIEEQVAEGDLVAGRWTQTFTNTGPYLTFPPNNKQIYIGGITITRVREGKIVEEWEARDADSLLQQMGIPVPLGPLEEGTMPEDTKAVVRRFLYDAWSEGDTAVIDDAFALDFINHNLLEGQKSGPEGMKQLVERWHAAFPDFNLSVDLMLGEGDRVVARWTIRGTHQATFLGLAATGKRIEITGISLFAVRGGRIKEGWGHWDRATLLVQLGALQFPQSSPTSPGSPSPSPPPPYSPGSQQRSEPPYS